MQRKFFPALARSGHIPYTGGMEVYVFAISGLRGREAEALALLSPERRDKALQIKNENARLRSLAAGLLLRRFVGNAPLSYGPAGKPYVPGGRSFSLSHSGEFAVIALDDEEVGVDIEPPRAPAPALLRRALTEEERNWVNGDASRFAWLWTRKEAALKRAGCGLGAPLREIEVLGEGPCEVRGTYCKLYSLLLDGYWISAAGDAPAFTPRRLDWEVLGSGEI